MVITTKQTATTIHRNNCSGVSNLCYFYIIQFVAEDCNLPSVCVHNTFLASGFISLTWCWCVGVCVATSTGVWVVCLGWSPWQVVVEISAAFAVQTLRVVFAHAAAVDLANKQGSHSMSFWHCQTGEIILAQYVEKQTTIRAVV